MTLIVSVAALVVLVAVSAVFSSSETALLSVSNIQLRQMLKKKEPKAQRIEYLKKNMPEVLTAILIGNNFVNSLSSSLAAAVAVSIFGDRGNAAAAACMTLIIIVFAEVLPKTIAVSDGVRTAARFAGFLSVIRRALSPLVWIFLKIARALSSLLNKMRGPESGRLTEGELKTLFEVGGREGTLQSGEKEMLHRIFEFTDLRLRDIARPRTLVKTVRADASYKEAVQAVAESGYSRLPVCGSSFDKVEGLIHFKDLLFYAGNKKDFSLGDIMHRVLFVPETQTTLSLLHTFKTEKQNFAVVVDEHGSNFGIVTMNDILKAVFGRIIDEYNGSDKAPEDRIAVVSSSEFVVPGDMLLSDVNNLFGLQLTSEECDTVAGWLLEQFGYLPEPAEHILRSGFLFTVEEQRRRRIQRIRIQYAREIPKEK